MKAFEVDWGGTICIVFADTAGQARSTTRTAAINAGFEPRFIDVEVRRAKWYDEAFARDIPGLESRKCYGKDQLISGDGAVA